MPSLIRKLGVVAALGLLISCRQPSPDAAAPALGQILSAQAPFSVKSGVWSDVRAFYRRRDGRPAWIAGIKPAPRADAALTVIRAARADGLVAADYDERDLTARASDLRSVSALEAASQPDAIKRAAEFDARLTTALLAFGRDVAVGHGSPADFEPAWKARRSVPDLPGTLAQAADGDLNRWLSAIRPQHPEYAALQKTLASLYALQDTGGWPGVTAKSVSPSDSGAAVVELRRRLAATGEIGAGSNDTRDSPVYDAALQTAVHVFQEHHAIKPTGIADAATIAALNQPIDARIAQIASNLERWRWLPDDFGPRYLLVNIPAYHVVAREDGRTVLNIRVIVGKTDHRTPVFSSVMTTVVFSPYWNIPDTIVQGETVPALAKDPKYLEKNQIEIVRRGKDGSVTVVDPSKVRWNDPDELRVLAFRQRPGPKNALGHVSFMFPNPFDVYMHDTPADELFAQPGRALSHGCIRVEQPEDLAKYVLRGDPEWDDAAKIEDAMNAGVEKQVALKQRIPVHIVYFTTWSDEDGGVWWYPDIYGYDSTATRPAAETGTK